MKVTAVVPAKGKSTRLSNKNLKEINGKNLIQIACEKLLACDNIDEVYIDSESSRIRSTVGYLSSKGLKVLKRPKELASNDIGANEMFIYALHYVGETDILIHHYCTSPLIKKSTIDRSIKKFVNSSENYDSFLTVSRMKEYFWKMNNVPQNFDLDRLPISQNLDPMFKETHGIYGIRTDKSN